MRVLHVLHHVLEPAVERNVVIELVVADADGSVACIAQEHVRELDRRVLQRALERFDHLSCNLAAHVLDELEIERLGARRSMVLPVRSLDLGQEHLGLLFPLLQCIDMEHEIARDEELAQGHGSLAREERLAHRVRHGALALAIRARFQHVLEKQHAGHEVQLALLERNRRLRFGGIELRCQQRHLRVHVLEERREER